MRKSYVEVMGFNRNLLTEIEKKNGNARLLSDCLKQLGGMISQAASVRVGKAREAVVTSCREAIKKKQFSRIPTIMEKGSG